MPPKARGAPLKPAGSQPAGRPIPWKLRADDREALHARASDEGSSVSDYTRELVEAAAAVTPEKLRAPGETVQQAVRFSQEQLDTLSHCSRAVGLDINVWLMLLTTPAGSVLAKQLEATRRARTGPKR